MCKLLGVPTGVCVRKRQMPLVGDRVRVCVFFLPPWVTEASLKVLMISARMCVSDLPKFLKSLFRVGTFSPGARDQQTDAGVCLLWVFEA